MTTTAPAATHNATYDIDAIIAALIGNQGAGYLESWGGDRVYPLKFELEAGFGEYPRFVQAMIGNYVVLCTGADRVAPASALAGLDLATPAKCGVRGVTAAKPTQGPAYRRRMWDLAIDGDRVGSYDTKREALAAAPTALAVRDWQGSIRATLAAIPEANRVAAAQVAAKLAPQFTTTALAAAAVVATCAEPVAA